MPETQTIKVTEITDLKLVYRGKVRDVYQIDNEHLLLVATDRISAFDCILPNAVPYKGKVLTAISAFWFYLTKDIAANHLITADFENMPPEIRQYGELRGRSSLVKQTKVFPVECVVRGYLEGTGLKDYLATGKICGYSLPKGLRQGDKLPAPIFTPATKAASGHDENISEGQFAEIIGLEKAESLKMLSLKIYQFAAAYALSRGIIIADTKFEFGTDADGNILLIDELLTPDSSRFWSLDLYKPGKAQPSFDKQFVREYLETLDWNKQPPAPNLPDEIVKATTERYLQAFETLTEKKFAV